MCTTKMEMERHQPMHKRCTPGTHNQWNVFESTPHFKCRVPMVSSIYLWKDNFSFLLFSLSYILFCNLIEYFTSLWSCFETIEKWIEDFVVVCYIINQHSVSYSKCFHLRMWCLASLSPLFAKWWAKKKCQWKWKPSHKYHTQSFK